MYIPTQEERYSKRSLVTLILCVIAPSGVYAYYIATHAEKKFPFPVDSIIGMLNLLLFFTYPLALMFQSLDVPGSNLIIFDLGGRFISLGGIICSLIVHVGLMTYIWKNKNLTPKHMSTIAILIGFVDLLVLCMINAGFFQN